MAHIRPIALMARLEPLMLTSLLSVEGSPVALRESSARGAELLKEAALHGAVAIFTSTDDAQALRESAPKHVLIIGISSGSWSALLCRGGQTVRLANPPPEDLLVEVEHWARLVSASEDKEM